MKKILLLCCAAILAFEMGCSSSDSDKKDRSLYEGDDPGECNDGADNNRDGKFDCDDAGCANSKPCTGSDTDPDSNTTITTGSETDSGTSSTATTDADTDTDTKTEDDSSTGSETVTVVVPAGEGWLRTEGNQILSEDGSVFRGRGANVHDTRNCGACYNPNVAGVNRRIDELVDVWGANFLRLCLESHEPSEDPVNDAEYMQDIIEIVEHIGTKPGVYVLASLWWDATVDATELKIPAATVVPIWEKLVEKLAPYSHVMFGLVNEPTGVHSSDTVEVDDDDVEVWEAMNNTVAAIRAVEARVGSPKHLIAVQGTRAYGKFLQYYPNHPITAGEGENIVYEVHVYYGNDGDKWEYRWKTPAETLPVIIGEFAEVYESWDTLSLEDCDKMIIDAEALDIPWLAWTFHTNCGNPLINADNSCEANVNISPTSGWGELIYNRLHTPWGSQDSALP